MEKVHEKLAEWNRVMAIHKVRCNIKSLAAEAKIIRQEERRAGLEYRAALTCHRRGRLREEARYAYLALGYLRRRAYTQVERNAKVKPEWARLLDKLKRYINTQKVDVEDWLRSDVLIIEEIK